MMILIARGFQQLGKCIFSFMKETRTEDKPVHRQLCLKLRYVTPLFDIKVLRKEFLSI